MTDVVTFPTCPECAAEGKPDCYPMAPANWYPIEDLPYWHAVWTTTRDAIRDAIHTDPIPDKGPA